MQLCNFLKTCQRFKLGPTTPHAQPLTGITHARFRLDPLSLATTHGITCCFLFLRVLRCFTSPRSLYPPYIFRRESPGHLTGLAGVPHSETLGSQLYYQLPEAYRRFIRPFSAPDAKAFTVCS